ncbi:hypothetical protein NDA18_003702 [Ustilago nuda]|nr:hypothetical protein NDA18_003702 [Ustilago nuda]
MVRTSDKQHLLDDIETAIIHSLMVESKMQHDLMDVDATWHPNDDLEESDDDMFDHAVSFALIRTYDIISQSRYTLVVGHPGSSHDARVWASGSGIVVKPRLHLDEGKFVWVDASYSYSSYTVGPYNEVAEYLKASETLSEAEVLETTSGMEAYQQATEDARIQRRENQQQYEQEQAAAMEGMSQN